ncbi:bifunctional 5,10-methylenetetrahydrofolate dehydrogenase/5,10-methenyltetrahydrofolate cyclohydrolase [Desulfitobacterium sp. AusDCA]|uniref:bifunctional 5,10-methylenetetrahydrofolate dehydrogenase/5,10-methenyltetrahydrofolate cyclohydrolase n=1 Tax=Desulfitobacterium sp. AusDCA TaxID=3240383 RepID=UPI003DA6F6DB
MSLILNAKPVVQVMKENLRQEVAALKAEGIEPTLGIIRVGSRPDDVYYENNIIKNCENVGIATRSYPLDFSISMEEFTAVMTQVNHNRSVHGIMLFRPLPKQLDEEVIKHLISADKDIDCMNPINLEKVFEGNMSGLLPCTPAAVIEILRYYKINLQGTNVVVMGRSLVVGKPLSMMLLKENTTVTICHSKTKDMPEVAKKADVIIAAMGKAKLIDDKYVSENSIVIDVGINDDGNGKICGDVDYNAVAEKVKAITPVPGGVGSVTTTLLLKNLVRACQSQR